MRLVGWSARRMLELRSRLVLAERAGLMGVPSAHVRGASGEQTCASDARRTFGRKPFTPMAHTVLGRGSCALFGLTPCHRAQTFPGQPDKPVSLTLSPLQMTIRGAVEAAMKISTVRPLRGRHGGVGSTASVLPQVFLRGFRHKNLPRRRFSGLSPQRTQGERDPLPDPTGIPTESRGCRSCRVLWPTLHDRPETLTLSAVLRGLHEVEGGR